MTRKPYVTGKRATSSEPSSRVRVYERADRDGIFMSCAWLRNEQGRVIEVKLPDGITWETAEAMADEGASDRRRDIIMGRDSFGEEIEETVTVGSVIDQYLESETAAEWSEKHGNDVRGSLAFWRLHLDLDADPMSLTPAQVRKIAGDAGRLLGVGPRWVRKRLKHLRAGIRWGKIEAKLYRYDPLEGTKLPDYEPDTDNLIYSEAETALLITPHEDIDWRVTLLANIAADTGRRISAMLSLSTEDVRTDGERVLLHFRGAFDKVKRGSMVPVSLPTAALIIQALERDLVAEWGWLIPEGRLDRNDSRDKPWDHSAANHALHDAESVLGIEWVFRRAYHGLKRRHVTTAMEVAHGDTALVGDLTGNASAELLRKVYRKANRHRTSSHVDAVRDAIEAKSGREDTPEYTPAKITDPAPPLES